MIDKMYKLKSFYFPASCGKNTGPQNTRKNLISLHNKKQIDVTLCVLCGFVAVIIKAQRAQRTEITALPPEGSKPSGGEVNRLVYFIIKKFF